MAFQHAIATNRYGEADLIVDTDPSRGTHTTLAGAMADATSGQTIFLRTSVTENVSLTAGVNIAAWTGGTLNTPTIVGTCTLTAAGSVSISGIRLQTNSAALLAVTGSAASIVNLNNCYLNCTNNTGITHSSSSSSSAINIMNCKGDLGTTGIGYFTSTSAGTIRINGGIYTNTGNSTTTSSVSTGNVFLEYLQGTFPIATTGTGSFALVQAVLNTNSTNTTTLTTAGTGTTFINDSSFGSGTASAISVGAGTTIIMNGGINSSNANSITGAGTFQEAGIHFTGTSSLNNATTLVPFPFHSGGISFDGGTNTLANYTTNTWTPNVQINNSNTGITYTKQVGGYTRIGNVVHFWASVVLSSKGASVGAVTISNLPIATSTNGANQTISVGNFGQVTAATSTGLSLLLQTSNTVGQFIVTFSGTGANAAGISDANITNTFNFQFNGSYIID